MIKSREIFRGAAGLAALSLAASAPQPEPSQSIQLDEAVISSLCTPELGDTEMDGANLAKSALNAERVVVSATQEEYSDGSVSGFVLPALLRVERTMDGETTRTAAHIEGTMFCSSFDFGNARMRLEGNPHALFMLNRAEEVTEEVEEMVSGQRFD